MPTEHAPGQPAGSAELAADCQRRPGLLGASGAAELLKAAGASSLVVGAAGGAALLAAAWPAPSRVVLAALTALGVVPFAAVAWTAVVPVVLLVVATGIAVALDPGRRTRRADGGARPGPLPPAPPYDALAGTPQNRNST